MNIQPRHESSPNQESGSSLNLQPKVVIFSYNIQLSHQLLHIGNNQKIHQVRTDIFHWHTSPYHSNISTLPPLHWQHIDKGTPVLRGHCHNHQIQDDQLWNKLLHSDYLSNEQYLIYKQVRFRSCLSHHHIQWFFDTRKEIRQQG